jgi:hypothetical protein
MRVLAELGVGEAPSHHPAGKSRRGTQAHGMKRRGREVKVASFLTK